MRPKTDRHQVTGAAKSREAAARLGTVAVRGAARCEAGAVRLDIGLSRFHADQDEAQALERALRARRPGDPATAFALVSAGRDGRARLKGLLIDGRRVELSWF